MKGVIVYIAAGLVAFSFVIADQIVAAAVTTGLMFCWFFWDLRCIRETGRQRRALIDATAEVIQASGYTVDYWPALDSVTFDRHLWLLSTFRNPWREYVGLPPGFPKEAA